MSIGRINAIRKAAMASSSYTYGRKALFYSVLKRHLKRKGYRGDVV